MSLDLSLWNIEAGLVQLMQMREEALESEKSAAPEDQEQRFHDLQVIDAEIKKYVASEVKKVDGIRAVWKTLQMLETNATAEAELQHQRALSYRRNLDRLKEACREVMESMPWREGKPKRIEGGTGSLLLKGNGGKQAVVISDESLVPDEFCTVTLTITFDFWKILLACATQYGCGDELVDQKLGHREPSLSLIGEALQRPCHECGGSGVIQAIDGDEQFPDCSACGGSGRAGVPGCSLAPRGQHVEIR